MKNGMARVRESYGVPAKRGMHVRAPMGQAGHMRGVIRSSNGSHIFVQFFGHKRRHIFHPTWNIEYLDGDKVLWSSLEQTELNINKPTTGRGDDNESSL